MKLSAKEWLIIFIELLIAIGIWLLSSHINFSHMFDSIAGGLLSIIIIAIIIAFIFGIIYKRIGEIDKALEAQELKQKGLEEKLKRAEDLTNIIADIKELKRGLN